MKFSPSSSISSSTTSLNPNICTRKLNALGCFSGFLSRILSSKHQPNYPFESDNQQQLSNIDNIIDHSITTNVVARLMGLDYMPKISSKNDQKDWNSINSGDFRDKTEDIKVQHTRIRPSFSIIERPNYFDIEDDKFIILTFDNKSHKTKKESKLGHKRKENCSRKQGKNRGKQGKNREFLGDEMHQYFDINGGLLKKSYDLFPFDDEISGRKEGGGGGIRARKKKNKDNCLEEGEVVCDLLENFSPISVLDDSEFISEYEVTTTSSNSEEDAKSREIECDNIELSTSSNGSSIEDELETQENGEINIGLKRRDYSKHDNMEMLQRVFRLAEVEELNHSNWKYKEMLKLEEVKEISLDFSQQIFDHLVNELVDQLV